MKKIKYIGNRRKGTLNPRRIWTPQETLQIPDDVAEPLLKDSEFQEITSRRTKKRPTAPPQTPGE